MKPCGRSKTAKKKWRPYDKMDRYVLSSSDPSKLVPLPPESESGNVEYKASRLLPLERALGHPFGFALI